MTLIRQHESRVVYALASLVDCNPFLPERVELERRALGRAFVPAAAVWHADGTDTDLAKINPNTVPLRPLVIRVGTDLRQRLAGGAAATPAELGAYYRIVLYLLFQHFEDPWYAMIEPGKSGASKAAEPVEWYGDFADKVDEFLSVMPAPPDDEPVYPPHLFSLGFQARRAFHYIFRYIFGGSAPAARLRARVWRSIFTSNVQRYRDVYYAQMRDITTLITGESGTGKELVTRAIALSRYVPFDAETKMFAADPATSLLDVSLSDLSPTLIEAELFGHRRGAFTGAQKGHAGWLESCGPYGTVFLDEIGEIADNIQVKLLRVLENRRFHRVGESKRRSFKGKIIAATNRNLEQEVAAGRFRGDLYHRLCGEVITTPTLREQLADAPGDLRPLLRVTARKVAGAKYAEPVAREVESWVQARLEGYSWPGNMRELEHCVTNVMIDGVYWPKQPPAAVAQGLADSMRNCGLTAEEVLQCYCATEHARLGNYHETARRLGLDPRTVRVKVAAWNRRQRGNQGR